MAAGERVAGLDGGDLRVPVNDVIDRLPEEGFDLDLLKNCVLYDADRLPVAFRELMSGDFEHMIFVFIRHFLDFVTREYVEDFAKIFPRTLQEKGCKLVFVGCAPSRYIRQFMEETSCSHPVFCDSSRAIYKCLGFNTVSVSKPRSRSPHIKTSSFVGFWQTIWRAVSSQTEQGNPFQMGGQLVINNKEQILFFHRDTHPLDHTPINDLLKVVGLPRIDFCTKYKIHHV